MKKFEAGPALKKLAQNKYALLVLLLGLLLLLLPGSGDESSSDDGGADPLQATGVSLTEESEKLAGLLAEISGVGRVSLLLSAEGATVVCDGADSPQVCLSVTNAVMAYTGLGSDRIAVMKMK